VSRKSPRDEHYKEESDHNLRQPVCYGNPQGNFRGKVSPQDGKTEHPSGVGECSDNSGNTATSCRFEGKSGAYPDEYSRDDGDEGVAEKGNSCGEEAVEPENTPHERPYKGPLENPGKDGGDVHDGGPTSRSGDRNKTQSRGAKDDGNGGKKGGNDDVLCLQCLHLRSSSLLGYQTKHRIENPKVRKPSGLFSLSIITEIPGVVVE